MSRFKDIAGGPAIYIDAEPGPQLRITEAYKAGDQTLEVVIPPEYMTKENKRVKARQIWGDITYTSDSDLVAVLMHMGFYAHYLNHPPPIVQEFRATLKLLPPQEKYNSKARFVKSRAWCSNGKDGCSYQVERCWLITRHGTQIDLAPCVDEVPAPYPTVQPTASDRHITTRTTGAKSKAAQEVSVQFNLVNEPWLKYTLPAIADKSLRPSGWVSTRLHGEVLFLESVRERFQLCYVQTTGEEGAARKDVYSFARCIAVLPLVLLSRGGVPMPPGQVEMIETNVAWEEFQWGVSSLHLRGKQYQLKRLHFIPITPATSMQLQES